MNKMSEEDAIAYLLQVPKDIVEAMYKEKGREYDIILDDIVPDEDIVTILKCDNYSKENFFNYKYFHLTNERIKLVAEANHIAYTDIIDKPTTDLEYERIDQLTTVKAYLEARIVDIDNLIRMTE